MTLFIEMVASGNCMSTSRFSFIPARNAVLLPSLASFPMPANSLIIYLNVLTKVSGNVKESTHIGTFRKPSN